MINTAGLEKTLRLIQSICQVVAAYMIGEEDAAAWLTARRQLALGSYWNFASSLHCLHGWLYFISFNVIEITWHNSPREERNSS